MANHIFVFGSNKLGLHGGGAAHFARLHHGAVWGQGEGLQGTSYGIPTKESPSHSLPISEVAFYVRRFKRFAADHPDMTFNVTPVGCGLAGFTPEEIGPMFRGCTTNVNLPEEFAPFIGLAVGNG